MGGIYSGLVYSVTQKNLVLSCDAPFIPEIILSALIGQAKDEDVLITEHDGKNEPLCAIYDTRCKDLFRNLIAEKRLKMQEALQNLNTVKINFDSDDKVRKDWFVNINTPEDLIKYHFNE